jgi:hypothetical protein
MERLVSEKHHISIFVSISESEEKSKNRVVDEPRGTFAQKHKRQWTNFKILPIRLGV